MKNKTKKQKAKKAQKKKYVRQGDYIVEEGTEQLGVSINSNILAVGQSSAERQKDRSAKWGKLQYDKARDIGPLPIDKINWKRRDKANESLENFCTTYLPSIFYLNWSDDQLRCINRIEEVCKGSGGKFALAMPRGGGKTALCRGGIMWATAFGFKRFAYFIGSAEPNAVQTMNAIQTLWYKSPLLLQDFPEIAFPIRKLENSNRLSKGQTCCGYNTTAEWGTTETKYPCVLLSKEEARAYPSEFVTLHEETKRYYLKNGGVIISCTGIDGSIRGEAQIHPITLEQPRPDIALLDDIQKDQKAESPTACEKIIRLVDGAIQGLSGPDYNLSCLMPCTVIVENDVADTYLNHEKKPEWNGERCKLVNSWPKGINDYEITLDSEEGRLWNEYKDIRQHSFKTLRNPKLATEFYSKNRAVMDRNFTVAWPDRYDKKNQISAQQYAMDKRIENPLTFPSEYQNIGKRLAASAEIYVKAEQLAAKQIDIEESVVPVGTAHLVCHIDIQNEIFFYTIFACEPDFTGVFIEYGIWPEVKTKSYFKYQTESWKLLSAYYNKSYPTEKQPSLEPKIYHGLKHFTQQLLQRDFIDTLGTPHKLSIIGIDSGWGQCSDVIKRFCREQGKGKIIPTLGDSLSPSHRQYEEYTQTKGWLFENQINPLVKEVKWLEKPDSSGLRILQMDVDRLKDFLMQRIVAPLGSSGSIAMYKGHHTLFAEHICNSEYPHPVTAKGLTKNKWQERAGKPDNDFLDTAVGCIALASRKGAYLKIGTGQRTVAGVGSKGKLSDRYKQKRQA